MLRGLSQGAPTVANCILSRPKPRGKLAEAAVQARPRNTPKHAGPARSRIAPTVASLPYWSIERPAQASHPGLQAARAVSVDNPEVSPVRDQTEGSLS